MTLFEELRESRVVVLEPGQRVIVVVKGTKDVVASGWIRDVDKLLRVVRVASDESGTDQQVDVDPDRYTVIVKPEPQVQPPLGIPPMSYTRPSRQGAFGHGGGK